MQLGGLQAARLSVGAYYPDHFQAKRRTTGGDVLKKAAQTPRYTQFAWLACLLVLVAACLPSQVGPGSTSASPIPPLPATATLGARPTPTGRPSLLRPALGTPERVRFDHVSLEHGLSQSSICCILQDRYGFMWFGTEDGLNKYDGYSFTVYKPRPGDPNSLSQNHITAIYEDTVGVLWIGTDGGGLDKFDRNKEQFTHYRYDALDPNSLSSNAVRVIFQDQAGLLWIGSSGGGLDTFDPATQQFSHYRSSPDDSYSLSNNFVTAIHQDREGVLWIGTDDGLNRYEPQRDGFTRYMSDSRDPAGLSHHSVQVIYEDRAGTLWVGTRGGGLNRFDHSTQRFARYQADPFGSSSLSNNIVWAIYEDREGTFWVGTNNGLNQFDRYTDQFTRYYNDAKDSNSLSSDVILSIYQDRSGVLWIGTAGGGINTFDRSTTRFNAYHIFPEGIILDATGDDGIVADVIVSDAPGGRSATAIRSIYQDREGALWIGTGGGGLYEFDQEGHRRIYRFNPRNPDSLSHDVIRSICEDQAGTLWIGTEGGGLDSFDRTMGRFTHHQNDPDDPYSLGDNTVSSVYKDREGTLWVGTMAGGLDRLDGATGRFVHYRADPHNPRSLSSNHVQVIYQDRAGALWIGTADGGVNRLDWRDDTGSQALFTRYSSVAGQPGSLSDNAILSIYEDRQGVLWLGTAGAGINKFDRETGTFTHYREQDGLPNDVVYGILEDGQGYLWLSTNKGLSKFDPRTESFRNYDVHDGLQSDEFSAGACWAGPSGEMFFGGVNGLNAFYPDSIQDNPYIPPIVLTSLAQGGTRIADDQAVESVRTVTLYWPGNFFEFEFAAVSYNQPEKNQYAYKLEGLDKDWNTIANKRFGRYTNLAGGTYTLKLKGSNNDGVWNEQGISIDLTVVPPVWQTWWFRGIVVLVAIGAVLVGYRLRINSIERRSHELEKLVGQRTAELRQEIQQRAQVEEALRQSEMEKAVAAERSRLARELHDVVTQTLFSASLVAEALTPAWEKNPQEGRQLLKELRQLTQGALAEMRTLLLELRPAALVETSLNDLLRQLAEAATGREGIAVNLDIQGRCHLPEEVHIALYRIAQEALNNVTRHARASRVTISLRCTPRPAAGSRAEPDTQLELCVRDNGCGFCPDRISPDHMGLAIMRERAQAVGATLLVESQLGHGSQITVAWKGIGKGELNEHT